MDESREDVAGRMREDWNARAREDAGYYVAFGRRDQDDAEFFATAGDVIRGLERELRRLAPGANLTATAGISGLRGIEIGCGPGRLMRPMARRFLELHGVDVSDEMIARAKEKLRDVPNSYPHVSDGSTLSMFGDEFFDFAYSYAVFQHIPSHEVIFQYLREIRRVLKTGGIASLHFNGLPRTSAAPDTWSGVRFNSSELLDFAARNDFQVLALDGVSTQYMWTTWRKQPEGWFAAQESQQSDGEMAVSSEGAAPPEVPQVRIRRITNAASSEPVAPSHGRFASISVWVENLSPDAGLHHLRVTVGSSLGTISYIGPPDSAGLRQVNVVLPELEATGLLPVVMFWRGHQISPAATLRVIPPGPSVPCIKSVTDGVNLVASGRSETRSVKVVLEEVSRPDEIQASIDGHFVMDLEYFCTDPRPQRFEVNFRLPEEIGPGIHQLELRLGKRKFQPVSLEVAE